MIEYMSCFRIERSGVIIFRRNDSGFPLKFAFDELVSDSVDSLLILNESFLLTMMRLNSS